MSTETTTRQVQNRSIRYDLRNAQGGALASAQAGIHLVLAGLMALVACGSRDLGPAEAPLGMASAEPLGPFGVVAGLWSSDLLPGRVAPGVLWVALFGDAGLATPAAVHVPATLALLGTGLILARRAWLVLGARAGAMTAACILGSLAVFERPIGFGFDPWTGLAIVAALDRITAKGSDLVAGLWAAAAVLCGGWPALAAILLPIVVLGRSGSYVSVRLIGPPLLAFAGWSAWALSVAPSVVWAEALVLPLKRPTSWTFPLAVLAYGLPWTPFAALLAWPKLRARLGEEGRRLVLTWLQVAAALTPAALLIPGLAGVAFVPMLAAIALVAAAGLSRAAEPASGPGTRRTVLGLALGLALAWAAIAVPYGAYLSATAPYYRPAAITALAIALVAAAFAVVGTWERRFGWAFGVVLTVAVGMKVAHAGVYVPEWNYRVGQGPWGRAIGHWVPPRWPIYVFKPWPADLAFATEHPFRQLAAPRLLRYEVEGGGRPAFVLLSPAEFEHWPESAPKLDKVRTFTDMFGRESVVARTQGDLRGRLAPPKDD